jgi:hypothetical protein
MDDYVFFLTLQDLEAIMAIMKGYKTNSLEFSAKTLEELRQDISGMTMADADIKKRH